MPPLTIKDVVNNMQDSHHESVGLYSDLAPVYTFTMEQRGIPQSYYEWITSVVPPKTSSIAEFACGDGSLLARLERTYEFTIGLDMTAALLSISRTKSDAPVIRADVRKTCLRESFEAVVMVGRSLAHMVTDSNVNDCFTTAYETISTEGRFIFDCHDKSVLSKNHTREREFEDEQYQVEQRTESTLRDRETGLAERTDKFVITLKETNDSVTVKTDPWKYRMFDKKFLKHTLETIGFVVRTTETEYGGHKVVAEK